jgi:inner membrane protein
MLPDLDAVAFKLGIPYAAAFGHRGISHSIVCAAVLGVIAALFVLRSKEGRWSSFLRWSGFFFLLAMTHPLLDACTDGGLGVAFLAPFSDQRFFFPFRPIRAAPLSIARFFTASTVPVILSEVIWVWIPAGVFVLTRRSLRRAGKSVDALPSDLKQ